MRYVIVLFCVYLKDGACEIICGFGIVVKGYINKCTPGLFHILRLKFGDCSSLKYTWIFSHVISHNHVHLSLNSISHFP